MNLRGKSREQIERICSKLSRGELTEIICKQVLVEQLLRPSEIARSSSVPRRTVLKEIKQGKFGDYFVRSENSVLVEAFAVNQWRERFRVRVCANAAAAD